MTVAAGGNTHLGDKVTTYNFYLEFLDGRKLNDGTNNSPMALSLPLGSATALCPSVRVAAGDFDNDGKASEVACIFSGPGSGYMFQIYKITRDANGSFRASKLYEHDCGQRDNSGKNIDGCDVAAGDFNGDGKQEVAAVFNDLNGEKSGYATVQIFYYSDGEFKTEWNNSVRGTTTTGWAARPHRYMRNSMACSPPRATWTATGKTRSSTPHRTTAAITWPVRGTSSSPCGARTTIFPPLKGI